MDTKLNYASPSLREIQLRFEENILSGEINDILTAAALAAFAIVSCNKESVPAETPALKFNFTVSDPPGGTRAIKQGWENGDVINIWFDTNVSKEPDMNIVYRDGEWVSSEVRAEIAKNLKEEGRLKYFWEGSNSWDTWVQAYYGATSYKPADGKGYPLIVNETGTSADKVYHFDKATNTITATLKWQYCTNIQVVVEGITPEDGYKLQCSNGVWTPFGLGISESNTNLSNGNVPILGVANEENTTAFSLLVINPGEQHITFTLIAPDGKECKYEVTKTFDFELGQNGRHFYAARLLKPDFYTDVIDGHACVDMGDGYYWATKNVGARHATQVGDAYAWGMTETHYVSTDPIVWKDWAPWGYDPTAYAPKYGDSMFDYNKYTPSKDNLSVLEPEDDAATANWGGSWRMPTKEEQQWLIDNCDWEPQTFGPYTGRKVTSKITGNSIYFPPSSLLASVHVPNSDENVGYYWSSTVVTAGLNGGFAFRMAWQEGEIAPSMSSLPRYFGTAIRAITVKAE